MITTVCKISYSSQTVPPIVPAVQGDTGRAISFEIADFTPPAGATATYFILKPSGEAVYNSATITDNSILCELTAQSLAEKGENRMQVRVLQGDDIVTSFEVILMVRPFLGDDAIESGTEMDIFDQAVAQATEQFQENAEQIVEEVIESIPADYTELTEEVEQLNERIGSVFSNEAKNALLNCLAHAISDTGNFPEYLVTLRNALYDNEYPMITVSYTAGGHTVYETDSIESLRQYLTVTYFEQEESVGVVVTNYTLSGELEEGNSSIEVLYNGLSATFIVVVDGKTTWTYPSTGTALIAGTAERYTSVDRNIPAIRMNTPRWIIGSTEKYVKLKNLDGEDISIGAIRIPNGCKGVTVTYNATPATDLEWQAMRLSFVDDYYHIIGWTNRVPNGTREILDNNDQYLIVTVFNTATTPIVVDSVTVVFDSNT